MEIPIFKKFIDMPFTILKSRNKNCPKCNSSNILDGVKLFVVQGDGRSYYFCGVCLDEYKIESINVITDVAVDNENREDIGLESFNMVFAGIDKDVQTNVIN